MSAQQESKKISPIASVTDLHEDVGSVVGVTTREIATVTPPHGCNNKTEGYLFRPIDANHNDAIEEEGPHHFHHNLHSGNGQPMPMHEMMPHEALEDPYYDQGPPYYTTTGTEDPRRVPSYSAQNQFSGDGGEDAEVAMHLHGGDHADDGTTNPQPQPQQLVHHHSHYNGHHPYYQERPPLHFFNRRHSGPSYDNPTQQPRREAQPPHRSSRSGTAGGEGAPSSGKHYQQHRGKPSGKRLEYPRLHGTSCEACPSDVGVKPRSNTTCDCIVTHGVKLFRVFNDDSYPNGLLDAQPKTPPTVKVGGVCGEVSPYALVNFLTFVSGVEIKYIDSFNPEHGLSRLWLKDEADFETLRSRVHERAWMPASTELSIIYAKHENAREYLFEFLNSLRVKAGPYLHFPRHTLTIQEWKTEPPARGANNNGGSRKDHRHHQHHDESSTSQRDEGNAGEDPTPQRQSPPDEEHTNPASALEEQPRRHLGGAPPPMYPHRATTRYQQHQHHQQQRQQQQQQQQQYQSHSDFASHRQPMHRGYVLHDGTPAVSARPFYNNNAAVSYHVHQHFHQPPPTYGIPHDFGPYSSSQDAWHHQYYEYPTSHPNNTVGYVPPHALSHPQYPQDVDGPQPSLRRVPPRHFQHKPYAQLPQPHQHHQRHLDYPPVIMAEEEEAEETTMEEGRETTAAASNGQETEVEGVDE